MNEQKELAPEFEGVRIPIWQNVFDFPNASLFHRLGYYSQIEVLEKYLKTVAKDDMYQCDLKWMLDNIHTNKYDYVYVYGIDSNEVNFIEVIKRK